MGGETMNIQQALEILQQEDITSSAQMIRRWIRQGKIKANLSSKKEGYKIDDNSLQAFVIEKKRNNITSNFNEDTLSRNERLIFNEGYKDGFRKGKENQEFFIKDAVRNREKELIQKGVFEKEFEFSYSEFKKSKLFKSEVADYFQLLSIHTITVRLLGDWAAVVEFGYYIDISILPYANRQLRTRLRDDILRTMGLAMRTDGNAYEKKDGIFVSKI
jgi:hypothetical protein